MKTFCKLLTIAALLLTLAATATAIIPQRSSFQRINPYQNNLQELANAQAQAVIDSTMAYVTLAPGDTGSVDSIWVQDLWTTFANQFNFIVKLDSGAIRVWFTSYYWTGMDATHYDDSHIIFDSLYTPGTYDEPGLFYGGRWLTLWWTALGSDTAGFKPGTQRMRD